VLLFSFAVGGTLLRGRRLLILFGLVVGTATVFWAGLVWDRLPFTPPTTASAAPASEQRPGTPTALTSSEQATIELFRAASPSVVFITTLERRRSFFSRNVGEIVPSGAGSGFVWDDRGHIITNFHVIENSDRRQITLADGTTWDADIIGVAVEKDLAVLHIDAPQPPFILSRSAAPSRFWSVKQSTPSAIRSDSTTP